jgi:serralysin
MGGPSGPIVEPDPVVEVRDYTALLAYPEGAAQRWNNPDAPGTAVVLTVSFPGAGAVPTLADYDPFDATGYSAFTAAQRQNFRDAAAVYAAACGVLFVEVESGGMIEAFAAEGSSYAGWAHLPGSRTGLTEPGRVVIDGSGSFDEGSVEFMVLLHELGHALGLKHPHEGDVTLAPALDDLAHTVMTYNNARPAGGYPVTLGSLDDDALRHLYGAAVDTAGWTWGFDADLFVLRAGAGADGIAGIAGRNHLWGGGGGDRLRGREFADLLEGAGGGDTLRGHSGADSLAGGVGRDRLEGGAGRDRLAGGAGGDVLEGGTGRDVFAFSGRDAGATDRIADFEDGLDLISLAGTGLAPQDLRIVARDGHARIVAGDLVILLRGVDAALVGAAEDFVY